MSWASKRQFQYLSILTIFVLFIIFLFVYPLIFKKPTCTDNKQNGTETGIDCGGKCPLMCASDITAPVVLWNRAFPVTDNKYNLVAFVENRNKGSGVMKAQYEFRVYDVNNKLLGRRQGETYIPANQQFVVFEPRFDAGQSELKSVTFEFVEPLTWVNVSTKIQTLPIHVKNITLDNNKDTPSLFAWVVNDSVYDIPEFEAIAVLYDANHNAINASSTHKGKLSNGSNMQLSFTWPEALTAEPVTKDVIVMINPFSVSIR